MSETNNETVSKVSVPQNSETTETNSDMKDEEFQGKKIRVKKWNAVASWSYDIENDTCAICHNQLMLPCITCEAEPRQQEDCTAAWGQCGHSYHFHCISRWLKTRSSCPLDDNEWEFSTY